MVAYGPASTREKSATSRPDSGPGGRWSWSDVSGRAGSDWLAGAGWLIWRGILLSAYVTMYGICQRTAALDNAMIAKDVQVRWVWCDGSAVSSGKTGVKTATHRGIRPARRDASGIPTHPAPPRAVGALVDRGRGAVGAGG